MGIGSYGLEIWEKIHVCLVNYNCEFLDNSEREEKFQVCFPNDRVDADLWWCTLHIGLYYA